MIVDDNDSIKGDLAQLSRLALSEQSEDVRLFIARLVRKYRQSLPDFAEQLDLFLKIKPTKTRGPLRKTSKSQTEQQVIPVDDESRLNLLKLFQDNSDVTPLFAEETKAALEQLILERSQVKRLISYGLEPTKSAIFVGAPGVGKTLTARWLASQLDMPLYVLDLTAVMSSFLGKSGANLRAALDFAKRSPCILLLDEIDAIAKRRGDDSDIGELKRLVTVMLQEVDDWSSSGLLLAATNHPELIDPALWRRFGLIVDFKNPEENEIKESIERFFDTDFALFSKWKDVLAYAFKGQSYSDIERSIQRLRRALALGIADDVELVEKLMKERLINLSRKERQAVASKLAEQSELSQHAICKLTGVSRDTIRKHLNSKDG
jgi:SpoVK/Ycf46/Vps4 family AAA+-type ATPase